MVHELTANVAFFSTVIFGVVAVMMYVVAVQSPVLEPGTVNPFGPKSADPSADTLVGQAMVQTVLMEPNDWHVATLTRLRDVEDLLDYLENQQVATREVHTLGNSCFAVRWK